MQNSEVGDLMNIHMVIIPLNVTALVILACTVLHAYIHPTLSRALNNHQSFGLGPQ